nr:uncharacterized protein LOC123282444 isoform X2 [Equus asinus]
MRVASWLELAPRIVWRSVHIGVPWPRALTLRTVPPLSVTGSCEDDVSCSQVLTTCLISQVQTKEEPLPPASSQSIPTFYFPRGRPQGTVNVDAVIAKIERTFAQFPHERATMEDMGKVAKSPRPQHALPAASSLSLPSSQQRGDPHLRSQHHHVLVHSLYPRQLFPTKRNYDIY